MPHARPPLSPRCRGPSIVARYLWLPAAGPLDPVFFVLPVLAVLQQAVQRTDTSRALPARGEPAAVPSGSCPPTVFQQAQSQLRGKNHLSDAEHVC